MRGVSAGEVMDLGAVREGLLRKRDRFDQAIIGGRLVERVDCVRDEVAG